MLRSLKAGSIIRLVLQGFAAGVKIKIPADDRDSLNFCFPSLKVETTFLFVVPYSVAIPFCGGTGAQNKHYCGNKSQA